MWYRTMGDSPETSMDGLGPEIFRNLLMRSTSMTQRTNLEFNIMVSMFN
jgi:hypothetical protein